VRSIARMLLGASMLPHSALLKDIEEKISHFRESGEFRFQPLHIALRVLDRPPELKDKHGKARKVEKTPEELSSEREMVNAWQGRVAQFLTYCVDGGLLGTRMTLADILHNNSQGFPEAMATLEECVVFMLHMRPKDLQEPYVLQPLRAQFLALGLLGPAPEAFKVEVTFTDRVMHMLIESGYIRSILPALGSQADAISMEYVHLLNHLLFSSSTSSNLKATICRQIIAAKAVEQATVLVPSLLEVMRSSGLFLATYACAALINLSQFQDSVKSTLMQNDVASVVLQQLRSNDGDLTTYALMLLVHLTKQNHHRRILLEAGLVPLLYDILCATYGVLQYKRRLITELCAVLGQMCNDTETREALCDKSQCVECLLILFETCEGLRPGWAEARKEEQEGSKAFGLLPANAAKVEAKVLFALKQLIANTDDPKDQDLKEDVGKRVIPHVMGDLRRPENLAHRDWASHAVMILLVLALNRPSAELMLQTSWTKTFNVLLSSPHASGEIMVQRIWQLQQRIEGGGSSDRSSLSSPRTRGRRSQTT